MKKVCYVATIPAVVLSFLQGHISASAKKWPVTVISNSDNSVLLYSLDAKFIPLAIQRKVAPWSDFLVLLQMAKLFRSERYDLVHSIMPKTGLLAMFAGWLTGVPIRIHTFTGQVWVTKQGWKRSALKQIDKSIAAFATHILVDSPSQRDFLISEGVLPHNKGMVIGHGSICGVDAHRFCPDVQARDAIRTELNIGQDQSLILFLGRLNRDKGILDLANAFANIASHRSDVVLLLVGAEEDVPFTLVQEICGVHRDRLRRVSFTPDPERYMAAADIFCLPSYREGFGQVIIEAAACKVPTVATRIYGISDAVEDGKTGLLFPAGDTAGLAQALLKLLNDHNLRLEMGEAARVRALQFFSSENTIAALQELYSDLLGSHS